jgi:hypothetical protein
MGFLACGRHDRPCSILDAPLEQQRRQVIPDDIHSCASGHGRFGRKTLSFSHDAVAERGDDRAPLSRRG